MKIRWDDEELPVLYHETSYVFGIEVGDEIIPASISGFLREEFREQ